MKALLCGTGLLLLGYLAFWPVDVAPKAWQSPNNAGYTGDFSRNNQLSQIQRIGLNGDIGWGW